MVAAVSPELITQLDAAVKDGASDRSGRILQNVIDLLLSNISNFGESQISVMDDVLARLVAQASRDKTGLHSLLIVRHGYLVLDAYFYPFQPDLVHDLQNRGM